MRRPFLLLMFAAVTVQPAGSRAQRVPQIRDSAGVRIITNRPPTSEWPARCATLAESARFDRSCGR
jgi:hypothetical protein